MPDSEVIAAVRAALDSDEELPRELQRDAVRALLSELSRRAPGKTVEVRVPPFGAVQCVEGLRHTRGTPPNVIECAPETFIALAAGRLDFAVAVADGRVSASGTRADLTEYLPLIA